MREITMYCSGRDQDVRVILTDVPNHDGQATIFDMDVVCLEIGESCTGALCPVCALPPVAIDAKLAKLGLRPEVHKKMMLQCDGCDRETEHVMSSGGYVSCTECKTTRRWTVA